VDRIQPEPPYVRIVNEIRRRIVAGELRVGDRVPSTRQITGDWGVAMATATKVLTALRQEGLVRAVPGIGTVVAAPEPQPASPPPAPERRAAREPEQGLTRERVVHTAIEVADAEGLSALSMRRVAAQLGVATMALYRYVPGKDELVVLMADAVLGEGDLPASPPPDWRAGLELISRVQWAMYRRHPWMAQVTTFTRPMQSLRGMAQTDWAMSAVDGLGLDAADMLYVAVTMASYVHGIAVNLARESEAEHNTGMTGDEWMESQESAFTAIFASGAFPTLARIAEADFVFNLDMLFEFGLRRMLAGFAPFLDTPRH